MTIQRHLNLPVHQRTVLVTVDTVRAARGVDADTILGQVDAGELRWAWDVSAGKGEVRELRLWAREIIAPEACAKLTAAAVVSSVIGSDKARWRGTELAQLLLVSRPHIKALADAKELPGQIAAGTLWVARAALEKFLTTRLQGQL